ncbi:hypothetical protein, partial [Bacillus toyonensis]
PRLLFHDSLDQKPKKSTSSNKFCSISTKKLKNRYIPAKHITKPIHPKATIEDHRLAFASIRAETLVLSSYNFTYHIDRYVIRGVTSPHVKQNSTLKIAITT